MKIKWRDDTYKTKVSDGLKMFWNDKENHDERVSMIKLAFEDPINREKNNNNSKKYWGDPTARERHSKLMTDMYIQRPHIKYKISMSSTKRWSDEEYRLKMLELFKIQGTLKVRIKKSCAMRNISIDDFDGFLSTEKQLFRCSAAYAVWRLSVFERDNYTCQECNVVGGVLNAHHILPYKDYKDVDISLNIQNGITLCESCHNVVKGVEYEYVDKFNTILRCDHCEGS